MKRIKSSRNEAFFSYSSDSRSIGKKAAIKVLERVTGYRKLQDIYLTALSNTESEGNFWSSAVRALNISMTLDSQQLNHIPKTGPCVVVANHPFGVLDGVILNHLVSQRRLDGKILINAVLAEMRGFSDCVLPVDFSKTDKAKQTNRQSRLDALEHVRQGGCLLVFPAGGVSTSQGFFGSAVDAEWRPFTAEVIQQSAATVVPVYFGGQNSRLFQVVSQVSATLRLGLLINEVLNKMNHEIPVVVGQAINTSQLSEFKDQKRLMQFLRDTTYGLKSELHLDQLKPRKRAA